MKKHILVIVALLCSTMTFAAKPFFKDINATIRAGYSIGGTLPVPMPQGIRSLERFKLGANLALGIDFEKPIAKNFGVMAGLRFELKNMSIDARVKNYHIKFIKGGQMMEGQFTGYNYSDATQTLFSLPIAATYNLKSWRFYAGLYIAMAAGASFKGYAHDGYLRVKSESMQEGDPTGTKIEVGPEDKEDDRGNYDFSDDMNRFQWGAIAGIDFKFYKRLGVFLYATYGINGVHKPSFNVLDQKLHPFYGTLGISYKL